MRTSMFVVALAVLSSFSAAIGDTLPYTWTTDKIKITVHGVFLADRDTQGGWIGDAKNQYRVLFSFENTSARTYHSASNDAGPSAGYFRLKTDKGNLYDPKYVGGETVWETMDPKAQYSTYNYAFNVQKDESPVELIRYRNQDTGTPLNVFRPVNLLLPPTTRVIKVGEELGIGDFLFKPLELGATDYATKGPYVGGKYALVRARKSWRFIVFHLLVSNLGKERKEPPIDSKPGDFLVKLDDGSTCEDISAEITFDPESERWVREGRASDLRRYPKLADGVSPLNPGESLKISKVFEVPIHANIVEVLFRPWGDIRNVRVEITNKGIEPLSLPSGQAQ